MGRKAEQLKVTTCHDLIFEELKKFKDPRPISIIPLESILMASFAVFALKCPSLLSFEKLFMGGLTERRNENLKRLFRLEKVPSDTQLRDVLDLIDYKQYQIIFKKIFLYLQRSKSLELFEFIKINNTPHYLIAVDGTGYFRSEKISCDNCLNYDHVDSDGNVTVKYGHNMLAGSIVTPNLNQVISLYPEAIIKQDGQSKNDSEQVAFRRFLFNFKKDHPRLKAIFSLDALYANGPIIKLLREYNYEFIIAVKNTKSLLFMLVQDGQATGETKFYEREYNHGQKIIKTTKLQFRYQNNVRLHQDIDSPFINFVEVQETTEWIDSKGKEQREYKKFSFITDMVITNNNVEKISMGGRTRWKIENETFNTLKNRGYNLEHNYGHGDHNLSYNFIMSMFLAFLVDQVQELSCLKFRKILSYLESKSRVWEGISSAIDWVTLESWDTFYDMLIYEIEKARGINTS